MNTDGEAAEQIVRMSLNGLGMAATISGAGAKHLAILLYAHFLESVSKMPSCSAASGLTCRGI
jgi:hypothetical protein